MTGPSKVDVTSRKHKKTTVKRLREEGEKRMAGPTGGHRMMTEGNRENRIELSSLEVLAETISSSYISYQVFLPLFPLGALILYFQGFENIGEAYAHILGKGVLFLFSTLLLISLFRTIRQARLFSEKLARKISLSYHWEDRILMLVFVYLTFYSMNAYIVHYCELVDKMNFPELYARWRIWSFFGIGACTISILFYWTGMRRAIRALSE